ncbi:unnamed protein product [Spodoptera littoralis]|uniref:Pre-mRNA-splicing factor SYF2 n=1 Tax=Spodoptera littoralis TaxID=7109 RepID=A0A9P0I3V6_SPOLI|nr:unnamed protein product [Spodoptera littoralis]CAH1639302.1 unnamed protein product [Spodoptera littoralis]
MSSQVERSSSAPKDISFVERQIKRIKRLRSLHSARNQARTHNQHEVVAEQARNKLPPNYEAKGRQAEWLRDDQTKHQDTEKAEKHYARVNLLNLLSAVEAERLECKKKKRNSDEEFSTYEQATVRQHNKLVKIMPAAGMEQYEKEKQKYGDAFYGGPNVIIHGMHEDRREAVDKMLMTWKADSKRLATLGDVHTITMQILITLTREMLISTRNWRDFTESIQLKLNRTWSVELPYSYCKLKLFVQSCCTL